MLQILSLLNTIHRILTEHSLYFYFRQTVFILEQFKKIINYIHIFIPFSALFISSCRSQFLSSIIFPLLEEIPLTVLEAHAFWLLILSVLICLKTYLFPFHHRMIFSLAIKIEVDFLFLYFTFKDLNKLFLIFHRF